MRVEAGDLAELRRFWGLRLRGDGGDGGGGDGSDGGGCGGNEADGDVALAASDGGGGGGGGGGIGPEQLVWVGGGGRGRAGRMGLVSPAVARFLCGGWLPQTAAMPAVRRKLKCARTPARTHMHTHARTL
jgi:hypothetical protein